jgi:hypothetical protein
LPLFLRLGQSVNLEGFGSFRISVSSEGADKPEDLNARHIKGVKLLFLPSNDLKRNLEGVSFEVESLDTEATPDRPVPQPEPSKA